MINRLITFHSKVWLYPGPAGWHFTSVPKEQSDEIKADFRVIERNGRSVRVMVTIGNTTWNTSIFPDKKSGTYFLPLKAQVRKKEKIAMGDTINILLEIVV